jgi:hypothetical protein
MIQYVPSARVRRVKPAAGGINILMARVVLNPVAGRKGFQRETISRITRQPRSGMQGRQRWL